MEALYLKQVARPIVILVALCSAAAQTEHVKSYSGPCALVPKIVDGPHYQVSGRVLDDLTDAPIPGAKLRLSTACRIADNGERSEGQTAEAVTDEDGHFAFDNIAAIGVHIDVSKDDYAPAWAIHRLPDDPLGSYAISPNTGPITLRLAPLGSISGTVRGEDGEPLAGAWIHLECDSRWAGWRTLQYCNPTRTAADGSYRFAGLGPGSYYLVTEPSNARYARPDDDANGNAIAYVPQRFPPQTDHAADSLLRLTQGERAQVNLQLHREILHRVAGTVSGGSKVANLVQVVDPNGSSAYLTSDPHGCCGFEAWLPNGDYRLESDSSGPDGTFMGSMPLHVADADISGVVFPLTSGAAVTIPIEISSIAAANAGCCGFWYALAIAVLPNGYVKSDAQSTQSGGTDAATSIRRESIALRPGSYALAVETMGNFYPQIVSSGGIDLIHHPLVITAGHAPDPIRIVLAEGASVEGAVSRDGKPCRAWIYAVPEQPPPRYFQPVLANPNGRFQMQGLAPGNYSFFATDVELFLDVHDPDQLDYWRAEGTAVKLQTGKNTPLALHVRPDVSDALAGAAR